MKAKIIEKKSFDIEIEGVTYKNFTFKQEMAGMLHFVSKKGLEVIINKDEDNRFKFLLEKITKSDYDKA